MMIVADYTSPSFVTKSSLPLLNNSQLLIVEQEEHSELLLLMYKLHTKHVTTVLSSLWDPV